MELKYFLRIILKAHNWELTECWQKGKFISYYMMQDITFLLSRKIGVFWISFATKQLPSCKLNHKISRQSDEDLIFKIWCNVWYLRSNRKTEKVKDSWWSALVLLCSSLHSQTIVCKINSYKLCCFLVRRLHLCACRQGDDSPVPGTPGHKPSLCWVRKLWLEIAWHHRASHPLCWIPQLTESHCSWLLIWTAAGFSWFQHCEDGDHTTLISRDLCQDWPWIGPSTPGLFRKVWSP